MNKRTPNLIYIFADQWRRQAIGFMNEDTVITPNMDNFSKESVVFTNAISCFPLCTPHRGAMLTGKYPISLDLNTNCRTGTSVCLKEDEICISDVLKENGYNTAYIGKWHLDTPSLNLSSNPIDKATSWDAFTPPGRKRHSFDFWYAYNTSDLHLTPHYWKDTPEKIHINKWSVEHETDVAIDYIKNYNSDKPFSLFLSYNPPHTPFDQVPEKYKKMYENIDLNVRPNVDEEKVKSSKFKESFNQMKNYFAAVTGIDDNFGRIIDTLEELGLDENTIVVLSSDHGEMMGSHGLMHKHEFYEESLGIPLLIRWKGKVKPKTDKSMFNSVDHMPTLLSLMNIKIPNSVEGRDLSNIVLDKERDKDFPCFIAAYTGAEKEESLNITPYTSGWRGIRTNRYTYVVHKGYEPGFDTKVLLFDNEKDPYQMNPKKLNNSAEDAVAFELNNHLKNNLLKLKDPFTTD